MALFVNGIQQMSREMKILEKGYLPPTLSYLLDIAIIILSIGLSTFFIFPFLRGLFNMSVLFAVIISLGSFVILSVVLGELIAYIVHKKYGKH